MQDCYIHAKEVGDKDQFKGILCTIRREEQKSMWRQINRATDKLSLGEIPFVQRIKEGNVINILDTEETNTEIQRVMEQWFDLSMSAPITMSSLRSRLGFLSDTDFATSLLTGEVRIPWDVDNVTAMIIGKVIRFFQILQEGHSVVTQGDEQFRYYWWKCKEHMSSLISGIHFGHYRSATYSDMIINFLSRKITLIAQGGCPPDCLGHGLQVMLEKVAGVALVNKLQAILLMEAGFNCMNKWLFGFEAINKMYALGYVTGHQYSQKESTAEDTNMDNKLTMDF